MSDLIPRDAAMDVIKTWGRQINENARMALLLRDMQALEPVDAAPVVHGHWITFDDCGELECSICGGIQIERGDYCTHCGAKMDGDDDE